MRELAALDLNESYAILTGPREIPTEIVEQTEERLTAGEPLVNVDRFNRVVAGLITEDELPPERIAAYMVLLASCSEIMAHQLAGDLALPRRRRLHEHNQSVLYMYSTYFAKRFNEPLDHILPVGFVFQDGGKAHAVAATGSNKAQAEHNTRFTNNLLEALWPETLSDDGKTVIELLVGQTAIGRALYRHAERNIPLDEAVAPAQEQLNRLRQACPAKYAHRFEEYLLVSYFADASAHTQRAQYYDLETNEFRPDVIDTDRFAVDPYSGKRVDRMRSLDRLFVEDTPTPRLFQPAHLAIMRELFPTHYSEENSLW